MKRNTTKDFIEKSILKHSDIYDYSLVEYIIGDKLKDIEYLQTLNINIIEG